MEALKDKITKLEENYKKEKEKIHQVIEDLEKRDRQMVEQISLLNTITSPSSSAQPSTSPSPPSDTPDHASSMLDFLNSFGNGLIPKCISSHTDTTAVQALIQTFTDHCAQMGHHG
eukprot:1254365-Karenia_brevis.AAC.1